MSVIIYGDEVYEIVKKKRKLETVEESVEEDNTDGGGENTQDRIVESESETFIKLLLMKLKYLILLRMIV